MSRSVSDFSILQVLLTVCVPPLGVFRQEGFGRPFWISVGLTLLGYVPGLVYAVWVLVR